QRRVEVQFGDCRISVPVEIIIRPVSSLAGRDTVIAYCPSGPAIDLNALLPAPQGSTRWLEPGLESGGSTFIPGTDAEGEYQYIVRIGDPESGCTDTSIVTLEETGTQELSFEPVAVCSEEIIHLGLPVREYTNILWWNGEISDSVTLYSGNTGPYWVEAERDGCVYRGDIEVERL
ncbi:hypothetical protein, partial [Membranihabitans maritimus]|uniref:hypothetical protein n=1 Tax=Membranihabitans maritimus TaxID=2904244 RepID=UPI001F413C21